MYDYIFKLKRVITTDKTRVLKLNLSVLFFIWCCTEVCFQVICAPFANHNLHIWVALQKHDANRRATLYDCDEFPVTNKAASVLSLGMAGIEYHMLSTQ